MKKICFIAWERFSFGGISRVLSDIINGLCDEYEITIVCLKEATYLENVYDIDFNKVNIIHHELTFLQKLRREFTDRYLYRLLNKFNGGVKYYLSLKYSRSYRNKLISFIEDRYDVVIGASGLNESYLLSAISHKIGGVKIGWMHTSFEGYFLQADSAGVEFNLKTGKYHLSKLDSLLVLSHTDAKKYSRFCRSIAMYNPVPFSCDHIANIETKSFIYVGALSKVKGVDVLIDAFSLFAKENSDWKLSIYGDGPLWDYMADKILQDGMQHRVTLSHSTKEVKDAYVQASALLFPSILEGFGIVQGEAMTCGLPIVAHRLPITEELIEQADCGLLYENSTKEELSKTMLQYVNLCLEEKRRLQQNALSRAKEFHKDKILSTWKANIL